MDDQIIRIPETKGDHKLIIHCRQKSMPLWLEEYPASSAKKSVNPLNRRMRFTGIVKDLSYIFSDFGH